MTFGLIGNPIARSFSQGYFTRKFEKLGLSHSHQYLNFERESVNDIRDLAQQYPDLRGLNVTIPHKENIIAQLDALHPVAERIGAVNTILVERGKWTGYNTDYIGFRDDLVRHWDLGAAAGAALARGTGRPQALVLGTGGASKGVLAGLAELDVYATLVSRTSAVGLLTYNELTPEVMADYQLIVNTTPVGTAPDITACPDLPYAELTEQHFCYDLVYNPGVTEFLRRAAARGAGTANGTGMLHGQAEAAWEIWNDHH